MSINEHPLIQTILEFLDTQDLSHQTLWIGFSGGVDSSVLLHSLAYCHHYRDQLSVHALHINHQLQTDSKNWATHCKDYCKTLNIPFTALPVHVNQNHPHGLEAAARSARYNAFTQHIPKHGKLLLAHHANDQAETVLQRLCNGQGLLGLSGMKIKRQHQHFEVLRPLLHILHTEILDYAKYHQIQPIIDPSNANTAFERNWLRQTVLPTLQARHPAIIQCIQRTQQRLQDAQILLDTLAEIDLARMAHEDPPRLDLKQFLSLPLQRQLNTLIYWLRHFDINPPNRIKLETLCQQLKQAKSDRHPECHCSHAILKKYRTWLYFIMPSSKIQTNILPPNKLEFDHNAQYVLPHNLGILKAHRTAGKGMQCIQNLTIKFRSGGERICLYGHERAGHRTLKKWLHEQNIPPWIRQYYPLIFLDQTLVYVPNLGISTQIHCKPNEDGWTIQWIQK